MPLTPDQLAALSVAFVAVAQPAIDAANAQALAAQQALAAVTAERDALKAQLAGTVKHVDPTSDDTTTVDIKQAVGSLVAGQSITLGRAHPYMNSGSLWKAAGSKITGDPANPIAVPHSATGFDAQGDDAEVAGICFSGPALAIRATKANRLHIHDCCAPATATGTPPALESFVVIERMSDGVTIENIGTRDNPLRTRGAGVFVESAANATIRNMFAVSRDEHAWRVTSDDSNIHPTDFLCQGGEFWSESSKECCTIREGEGTIDGTIFHGNFRTGQGAGTDNVTLHMTGGGVCDYCYPADDKAQNSQLDLQSGTTLKIDNWTFDQTNSQVAPNGHAMQQAISGSASSTVEVGDNVVILVREGITPKPLVSGAKVTGQPVIIKYVPLAAPPAPATSSAHTQAPKPVAKPATAK